MAKLSLTPCACIRAGHCHREDGTSGHLWIQVGKRSFFLRRCKTCGERPGEHDPLLQLREKGF